MQSTQTGSPTAMTSLSSKPIAAGKLHKEELPVSNKRCVVKNFRAISTGQLHTLRRFHPRPINVVVSHGSSPLRD